MAFTFLAMTLSASMAQAAERTVPQAPEQWSASIESVITGRQIGKVQGVYYNDEVLKAFRTDKPGYAPVITLYKEKVPKGPGRGITMAVVNGICKLWCPASSIYVNMIKPGDGKNGTSVAKDGGATTVHGRSVEQWSWSDTLGVLPMDSKSIFLVPGNFTPVELVINEPLSRFREKSDFLSFSADPLDPSTFAVSGIESCPQSKSCGGSENVKSVTAHLQPSLQLEL